MPVPWRSGASERRSLSNAMVRGELELHYQTIHDLRGGEPTSVEALVRWKHPLRGNLAPGEFVPNAESNGMIVGLGAWVLRTALQQMREWTGSHPCAAWTMSVNVSGRQLEDASFVRFVVSEVQAARINPSQLMLEVTETYRIHDLVRTADLLARLRDFGVRVALDDFGSGYLNVQHLQKFPADRVKVDRQLTSALGHDERGSSVLKAIVEVSRELGMDVVVEGIETAAQRTLALEIGATHGQGWFYSKARPARFLGRPDSFVGLPERRASA